jgi:hypothetical protein
VRWDLEVAAISEKSVSLVNGYGLRSAGPGLQNIPSAVLGSRVLLQHGSEREMSLRVGDGISVEEAAKLHRGDKLPVKGEVVSITMEGMYGVEVKVTLKGLRAE